MLHRAILGSLERFMGILIEHTAGAFPAWLAPVQVAILPITDRANAFATEVSRPAPRRSDSGRSWIYATRSLKAKIRDAQLAKVPYMLVIGDREAEGGTVSVRHRHRGDLGVQPLDGVPRRRSRPKSGSASVETIFLAWRKSVQLVRLFSLCNWGGTVFVLMRPASTTASGPRRSASSDEDGDTARLMTPNPGHPDRGSNGP